MKQAISRDNWLPWSYFPLSTHNGFEEALESQLMSAAVEQGRCLYRDSWTNETVEMGARNEMIAKIDLLWEARGGKRLLQAGPLYSVWAGPDGVMQWGGHTIEMASFVFQFVQDMREASEKIEPAGTGKSHFVRGLLEAARKKASFCLVPPHMITSLDGPDLVGALRELKEPARHRRGRRRVADEALLPEEKAIVLVLEDADACLVPRQMDNISTIAALLNMSDGIFGAALDLRIIATTNAKSFEIDPAVERPGRLLTHVMFDELNVAEANVVLKRLGASEQVRQSAAHKPIKTTLAKLYAMARKGE